MNPTHVIRRSNGEEIPVHIVAAAAFTFSDVANMATQSSWTLTDQGTLALHGVEVPATDAWLVTIDDYNAEKPTEDE